MKKNNFLMQFLLCFALATSCNLATDAWNGKEKVTIRLPAPHTAYSLILPGTIPSYTIRWYDAKGTEVGLSGVSESVTVELEAGVMTPVLVIPETDFFPVAGAIYPIHASVGKNSIVLETTRERGISAGYAETICLSASGGFDSGRIIASHFNWLRFDKKIAALPNPFLLDREKFLDAVLSGKVTVYDIVQKEQFAVKISLPAGAIPAGTEFVCALQGKPAFIWSAENSVTVEAPEGLSRFFSPEGFISVQIDKEKLVCTFFSHFVLQD